MQLSWIHFRRIFVHYWKDPYIVFAFPFKIVSVYKWMHGHMYTYMYTHFGRQFILTLNSNFISKHFINKIQGQILRSSDFSETMQKQLNASELSKMYLWLFLVNDLHKHLFNFKHLHQFTLNCRGHLNITKYFNCSVALGN